MRLAALVLVALGLLVAPVAAAAEPIACPAKVGSLELANPNSTFPGTQGSLRGDPQVRATYVCSYGERSNGQAYITGTTYLVTVSWAGSRATAADLVNAKGCGVTLGSNPSLEYASATRRAWADFNNAIEPHTAALRAATQALLAQAEALALGCGTTSSPGAGTTTAPPATATPPVATRPTPPPRRRLRWRFRGVHAEDDVFVVARGSGTARPLMSNGAMTAEQDAQGSIVLSFYRGFPTARQDALGLNDAKPRLTGRIWLSVHGPGNYEAAGNGVFRLHLVVEVDDVKGTARMRRMCRAAPFGLVAILAKPDTDGLGMVAMGEFCSLQVFYALDADSDRWLPEKVLQIADVR